MPLSQELPIETERLSLIGVAGGREATALKGVARSKLNCHLIESFHSGQKGGGETRGFVSPRKNKKMKKILNPQSAL